MSNLIISPYALTFDNIREALQNIITSSSATEKWKDFFTAGAGETILELDAAVAAFLAFHAIVNRRESLLTVAKNPTSIVGLGEGLGYNSSRGRNITLDIQIVPDLPIKIEKWMVIGQYREYDIVYMPTDPELDQYVLTPNQVHTLRCVIGDAAIQSFTIQNNTLQQFTFTASKVTDDIRLVLNDDVVPHSTELKDAVDDKYIALTNAYGAVDVFYNNNNINAAYKYSAGDTIYLHYIESNNLTFNDLSVNHLTMYNATRIEDIILYTDKTYAESSESIKINAPIYHETNNKVRARKDYAKVLKQLGKNIFTLDGGNQLIDVNDWDISPGLIALTYLKQNKNNDEIILMTEEEKDAYLEQIMSLCPDGVANAIIMDPIPVIRTLNIKIKTDKKETMSTTFLSELDDILKSYANKLGAAINIDDIEQKIEDLSGVKTARISFGDVTYKPNTRYKKYDKITIEDIPVNETYEDWQFFADEVITRTGDSIPDWAYVNQEGDTIIDNNYVWLNNKTNNSDNLVNVWQPNTHYSLYSDLKTTYYIQGNTTLNTEPIWGDSVIKDGGITWKKLKEYRKYNTTEDYSNLVDVKEYKAKMLYNLGDYVIVEDDNNKKCIYEAVKVKKITGTSNVNWNIFATSIQDNAITWKPLISGWVANHTYSVGDTIGVTVKNTAGLYYVYEYQALTAGTSGTEKPSVWEEFLGEQRVQDANGLIWELTDNSYDYYQYEHSSSYPIDACISQENNYYICIDNSNTITDTDTTFYDNGWDNYIYDNCIEWEKVKYNGILPATELSGSLWKPSFVYNKNNQIIVQDDYRYFVYICTSTDGGTNEDQINVVFTAVNYAGKSGEAEPKWLQDENTYNNNLEDNNILWTISKEAGLLSWEPNTDYMLGDIIKVNDVYYRFTSILGKTSENEPNWDELIAGKVEDNDIVWKRIYDEPTIQLAWNEYLQLDYNIQWK